MRSERPIRRFQFGLRSLFVLTTGLAMWLGLARLNPALAITLAFATVVFLPFFFLGRWLMRNGQTRTGIGCLGSILAILAPWVIVVGLDVLDERTVVLCGLAACGLIGLFICFCALVPFLAEREKRRSDSEDHTRAEQGDE
jgi:peptidoglycan/LPS O-acetylase OafA/YrhL